MPGEKKSQFFKDKVVQMAAGAEYVKIDRESNFQPDHRERPNNQYPEEFKRRVARAASVNGVKLTWVGLRFNVLPETVKGWCEEYN